MAEKRDLIDEFIDIKNDWQSLSNPVSSVANALAAKPEDVKTWNPADYKQRPRTNLNACVAVQAHNPKACTLCLDVCPVNAIDTSDNVIEIADSCRKCGLCSAVCPSECFTATQITPRRLYERMVRAASAFEHAYVTCTRALGRIPYGNEVVLPCVGAVSAEVWYAVLAEYPNVSVYLPLGVCDRCRNLTGEETLAEQIARAEEMLGRGVGLEVDEAALVRDKNHAFERKEFLDSLGRQGMAAVTAMNPAAAAARSITAKINENTRRLNALTHSIEGACAPSPSKRRRVLTQRRQLVLNTLQKRPKLAVRLSPRRPACNQQRCTLCGDCARVCPTRACEITDSGVFKVEPSYCVECGACLASCPEKALDWEAYNASELVVPDKEAEDRKKRQAEQKAELERLKQQGKAQLMRGLDFLESLDDDG